MKERLIEILKSIPFNPNKLTKDYSVPFATVGVREEK